MCEWELVRKALALVGRTKILPPLFFPEDAPPLGGATAIGLVILGRRAPRVIMVRKIAMALVRMLVGLVGRRFLFAFLRLAIEERVPLLRRESCLKLLSEKKFCLLVWQLLVEFLKSASSGPAKDVVQKRELPLASD